jgi:hypothetical protein
LGSFCHFGFVPPADPSEVGFGSFRQIGFGSARSLAKQTQLGETKPILAERLSMAARRLCWLQTIPIHLSNNQRYAMRLIHQFRCVVKEIISLCSRKSS